MEAGTGRRTGSSGCGSVWDPAPPARACRAESPTCLHRRCARACLAIQSPPAAAPQVGARFRVPRPRRRDPAACTCAACPRGPSPAALPATPHLRRALGVLPGEGTVLRLLRAAGVGRPPTVLLRPQQALGSICAALFWGTTPLVAHLPFRPAAAPKSRLIQLARALESWRLGLHSSQASLVLLLQ